MNDKQLLELSASAAWYPVRCRTAGTSYWLDSGRWDPLNSDANAFRIMVDLNLNVFFLYGKAYAMDSESDHEQQVEIGNDKHAAMRMAIVLCAASIGKQMGGV